jgi:hypothetical protein
VRKVRVPAGPFNLFARGTRLIVETAGTLLVVVSTEALSEGVFAVLLRLSSSSHTVSSTSPGLLATADRATVHPGYYKGPTTTKEFSKRRAPPDRVN